jgi:hypothetical protein
MNCCTTDLRIVFSNQFWQKFFDIFFKSKQIFKLKTAI